MLAETHCGCADVGLKLSWFAVMASSGIIVTLLVGSEPVRDNEYGRKLILQALEDEFEAFVWKVPCGESQV